MHNAQYYAQYTMHNMHDYMHNTRCFKSALQSFALRCNWSRKSVWWSSNRKEAYLDYKNKDL